METQSAIQMNVFFLAVVASWRVALFVVFLRRTAGLSVWAVVVATLLPLAIIVVGLTLLNLERPMGDTEISYGFVTAAVPAGSLLLAFTAARQLVGFLRDRKTAFGGAESPL